jgi:hypothetical protein
MSPIGSDGVLIEQTVMRPAGPAITVSGEEAGQP